MTMELEEAFPSFSTERIRSKILIRDAPATQRRLDYNAPLLSVRRLKDGGGGARSKVWKLSAELSKESLTVPGAVPFTWEHSPGRPKETEALTGEVASVSRAPKSPPAPSSPPRLPSSPSPPSTPSPPSARRASPASPPLLSPPPLRPRFIRSHSSTLFAPPPPPPPPPPPVPSMHSPFRVTQRSPPPTPTDYPLPSSSLRIPPHPPPPPPATHTSTAHDRGKAFRLFDPTEDLLRALRARREKLEASEVQSEATGLFTGTFKTDASSAEPKDDTNTTSCDVVDGIVRRFRADHPDASTEKEAFGDGLDSETQHGDDKGMSGAVNCNNGGVASISSIEDDDAARHCKTFHLDARNDDIALQENVPALRVCSDEDAEEMGMQKPNLLNRALSGTFEGDKLEPVAVCVSQQPFTVAVEVQSETGHKQVSLTKKQQQNKCRRSNSVAILDSCRVETLRMLKSVLVQLCRKAATASQQTLGKAKRMITGHCSSVEVVQHRNSSAALNGSSSNLLEHFNDRQIIKGKLG
ncbi:hypothetical protein L7F22_066125 [Adiantum nelumboides]|nr:hypothetical protein [Adiantum nelumboides]